MLNNHNKTNIITRLTNGLAYVAIVFGQSPHSVFLSNLTEYTNSTEFFSDLSVTGETGHLPDILPTTVAACLSFDELYYCDIRLGEGGCRYFYL